MSTRYASHPVPLDATCLHGWVVAGCFEWGYYRPPHDTSRGDNKVRIILINDDNMHSKERIRYAFGLIFLTRVKPVAVICVVLHKMALHCSRVRQKFHFDRSALVLRLRGGASGRGVWLLSGVWPTESCVQGWRARDSRKGRVSFQFELLFDGILSGSEWHILLQHLKKVTSCNKRFLMVILKTTHNYAQLRTTFE